MLFYNLNKPSEKVDFRTATIQGWVLKKDYFFLKEFRYSLLPGSIILKNILTKKSPGTVMNQYVGETIPEKILRQMLLKPLHLKFR